MQDILQVQSDHCGSNMFENKRDTALSKKNYEEVKSNCLTNNINLSITFEEDKSTIDVPNAKLQTCQLSSSESRLSYDDRSSLRNSLSHCTSVSLPAISSLDLYLIRNKASTYEKDVHTQENVVTACTDEEETLFNQLSEMKDPLSDSQCSINKRSIKACQSDPREDEHKKDLKERIAESGIPKMKQFCEETIDSRLQIKDNKTTNERNQVEVNDCKNGLNSTAALSINARGSIFRPTLADDSKLVKMSLLTNPMNIMQSNVQLLNKSRNFLNFITEKSTNIMEKALLPQHLAMKYNYISKSVESDVTGLYNNVSSSTDITSRLDIDSTTNNTNCTVKQNHNMSEDNSDNVLNNEKEINPPACTKESKTYDDSGGQLLYNNNLENEVVSDEKKYHVFKNNDFDRLDCDVTNKEIKCDVSMAETDEYKSFLQTDELYDDAYKENLSDSNTLADSNILKYGSLEHPSYLALLEDYTSLKLKHSKLLDRMEYFKKLNQSNNSFQETETNTDALILRVENLEKTVNKLTADLNTSLDMQEALKKECATVNKEKENMVMRYVTSEKQLIDMQRYL